jgi:sugar phosphate isomerase/epimerase
MTRPKLACCNFLPSPAALRRFAFVHGFDGIEWSFQRKELPRSAREAAQLRETIASLAPLEIRYHCAFKRVDPGDADPQRAASAMQVLREVCELIARLEGEVVTIHVGLGRDSTVDLSWDRTLETLAELVRYAQGIGVRVCLENLAWGWTSRPQLYEKLLRKARPWATLDIGHARVSPAVRSQHYDLEDFVAPHPERFLNAHIYHEEDGRGHLAPRGIDDLRERLRVLRGLPHCDWWVLELRERVALLQTLAIVRELLAAEAKEGRT